MTSPPTHRCDVPDCDYSKASDGLIRCLVCGARWLLNKERGWVREPNLSRSKGKRNG